jgi:hypothetical protein
VISGLQLLLLMKTLPQDQDAMEAELANYAAQAISWVQRNNADDENASLISIEERINTFDSTAAKETYVYVRDGIKELRDPFNCAALFGIVSGDNSTAGDDDIPDDLPSSIHNGESGEDSNSAAAARRRRQQSWRKQEAGENVSFRANENHKWTDETLLLPRSDVHRQHAPSETTPLIV